MHRFSLILLACLAHGAMAETPSLRVARYSTLQTVADHQAAEPLAAIVDADFNEDVQSVGDALAHALSGSGYRLITTAPDSLPPLMALPLPANQRTLGAMRLSSLLELLAGPAHTVVIDRAHRLVALQACPFAAMRALP